MTADFGFDNVDPADPVDGVQMILVARRRDGAGTESEIFIMSTVDDLWGIVDPAGGLVGGEPHIGSLSTVYTTSNIYDYSFGCYYGSINASYQGDEVRCNVSYHCT